MKHRHIGYLRTSVCDFIIMMASRQGLTYLYAPDCSCYYAIATLSALAGLWLGCISAVLTSICVAYFLFVSLWRAEERSLQGAVLEDANRSSHIFTEATIQELEIMQDEEYSPVARIIHLGIETWTDDVENLIYVAQILSENRGLQVLFLVGVSLMVLAIVAGLNDVNVVKALYFSVTCYGTMTVVVARSAMRNVDRLILRDVKPKLSSAEVTKIIEAIHEESFIRNDELGCCDLRCLRRMLSSRNVTSQDPTKGKEVCEWMYQDLEATKKNLIVELKLRRKYSVSCCICLDEFAPGDRIRVLPGCHHEFHNKCIDEWARTFVVNKMRINHHDKSGNPSCPLCKTIIRNVPSSSTSKSL